MRHLTEEREKLLHTHPENLDGVLVGGELLKLVLGALGYLVPHQGHVVLTLILKRRKNNINF